jgi:23S rRNA (cytidine2498-2'-O)-methyltransferase
MKEEPLHPMQGNVRMENLLIVTAQPEFLTAALDELKRLDQRLTSIVAPRFIEGVNPGIALCAASDVAALMRLAAQTHPIFVRHLAPAQALISLTNTERDIGKLALAVANLPAFQQLERGVHFAVQTRLLQTGESHIDRPYTSGQLNQALAEAIAEETGAVESIKKPQVIVSLLCTSEKGYLGISTSEENLSDWPGGMRHFAQTPEQISRAEFKLLEALEVFGVTLPARGHALDLGAAPGGWTRLLLKAGLHVVAVDPAQLDPRLVAPRFIVGDSFIVGEPRLEHYRGYAETYLGDARRGGRDVYLPPRQDALCPSVPPPVRRFDVITNDMRMDAREAARLLVQARQCLRTDGFVISTLKLPHATREIDPLKTLKEALGLLRRHYGIVQARQLFHNRQEVTVIAAQPR